jgi:outer membrane lipoprotein-sorting protein
MDQRAKELIQKQLEVYAFLEAYSDRGTYILKDASGKIIEQSTFSTLYKAPTFYRFQFDSVNGASFLVWSDGKNSFLKEPGRKRPHKDREFLSSTFGISRVGTGTSFLIYLMLMKGREMLESGGPSDKNPAVYEGERVVNGETCYKLLLNASGTRRYLSKERGVWIMDERLLEDGQVEMRLLVEEYALNPEIPDSAFE